MSDNTSPAAPAAAPEAALVAAPAPRRRFLNRRALMLLLPALLIFVGGYFWLFAGRFASTDNAYIQQNMVAIVTEVFGRVADVAVAENQQVSAGDLLFRIDPQSYRIALQQAEAAVAAARLQVEQLRATYHEDEAELAAAQQNAEFQEGAFGRTEKLARSGTASRASFDEAENDRQAARQRLAKAEQALAGARAALTGDPVIETDRHPLVLQALAMRDKAALDLQHTELHAPAAGIVSQTDRLQPGQYLPAGTSALAVVETGDSWIEANFKETDLAHMRPGQTVEVSLDAYPGSELTGKVVSLGAGTGSEFSLLPAQNATGNWVKVVQRVPVRIRLDADAEMPLRAGLSVSVSVDTGHRRPVLAALIHASDTVIPIGAALARR